MSAEQRLDVLGGDGSPAGEILTLGASARLVVAGYTGRDAAAVQHHIDELAAIGVPPPESVPMLYRLDRSLVTSDGSHAVPSAETSGEVEPVFVRSGGRWYLGVGSDHTDRGLERDSVERSKAVCVKPIGRYVVRLPDDVVAGGFDAEWDAARMVSTVDGVAYQDAQVSSLRPPSDLLPRILATIGDEDLVVFAGTAPLLGGTFVFGHSWHLALSLGSISLTLDYDTTG